MKNTVWAGTEVLRARGFAPSGGTSPRPRRVTLPTNLPLPASPPFSPGIVVLGSIAALEPPPLPLYRAGVVPAAEDHSPPMHTHEPRMDPWLV
ncbi:MAG TPA: hypothetical protein VNL71_11950 [Chloroflexota bacterium]|nr:hypothetical protein [Chloroflexota bacterium]